MRYQFYKVRLRFEKATLPVTVAAFGIENLEGSIQATRPLYEAIHGEFYGFVLDDTKVTVQMTPEQYDEELSYCDIVQDEQPVA